MKTKKQIAILRNIKRVLSRRTTKTWLFNALEVDNLVDRYSKNYKQANCILTVLDRVAREKTHGDAQDCTEYFSNPGMNVPKILKFLDATIAELSE